MEIWSRLLSRTPLLAGPSRKEIAKDPVQRRNRFDREYRQLLQTWHDSSNLVTDVAAADTVELRIHELTDILLDESRRPLPHTCLSYAAELRIYVSIGRIASASYNLLIVKEAVNLFGTLIESEDDAFVESHAFASSLANLLVRITGANSIRLDLETETKVVELAFNITTKIRLHPEILPAWFRERQSRQTQPHVPKQGPDDDAGDHHSGGGAREKQSDGHERFKGKTQRQDFPLFYILTDYIHAEGKVGDFARTGLLYIIESASAVRSASLEQWIVESDLSTLMATGLGALYSQLSRKLVIDHPSNNLPPILALSDYEHPHPAFEVVSSCSPEFQAQLNTFLSHLLFWQDVLNHCRSEEVKSTLLEHFQVIFLQQLLYPSLLESSDIDGGSSVAVLTYLRRILESLDHPDMINLILHYLLALPDATNAEPSADQSAVTAARKRKSMDLATIMASKPEVAATPLLFNLVDLILACLKSQSQHTINVTLQLVSVILRRHHRYAVMTLVRTSPVSGKSTRRTIGAHQQDIEFFMVNAGVVGGQDSANEVYDNILKDVVVRLESHPCSLKLTAPKVSANNHDLPAIPDSLPGAPRDVCPHTIQPDEPLLTAIIDRLETFFVNPVDTNLLVTEAFLDLATCGYVSLEGWLLRHPDSYVFPEHEGGNDTVLSKDGMSSPASKTSGISHESTFAATEQQVVRSMQKCRRRPQWAKLPRILVVLQTLSDQAVVYQQSIPRFADLLQQRREAFQTADSVPTSFLPASHKRTPGTIPGTPNMDHLNRDDVRSNSPARPSGLEGFAQRILSELGTPSRSASPRSKKESGRGFFSMPNTGGSGGSMVSGGHGFVSPILAKSIASTPKEPTLYADTRNTPSKSVGMVARSRSPSSQPTEVASWDGRDSIVPSQVAAFQAIDRQTLARRVGMPTKTASELPLLDRDNTPPLDGENPAGQGRSSDAGGSTQPSEDGDAAVNAKERTATVSHILTNTVILQSFLFELAAVLQARAGLFDEVLFAF